MGFTLEWHEDSDDHGNTVWSAVGHYIDGFEFKITPVLEDDRIRFTLDESAAELVDASERPTRFDSVDEAKQWAAKEIASAMSDFEPVSMTYQVAPLDGPYNADDREFNSLEEAQANVLPHHGHEGVILGVWTGQDHGSELVAIRFQGRWYEVG